MDSLVFLLDVDFRCRCPMDYNAKLGLGDRCVVSKRLGPFGVARRQFFCFLVLEADKVSQLCRSHTEN